jgi:hypothetical protein
MAAAQLGAISGRETVNHHLSIGIGIVVRQRIQLERL